MGRLAILGVFVADTSYRAKRQPSLGETILGESFALGPGGKGSNQAVAAARAGAEVRFVSRIGQDTFADLAFSTWEEAGVIPEVVQDPEVPTGAAYIFIEAETGNNAIIIAPGAGGMISAGDVDAARAALEGADVFITQLEQPMEAAMHALGIARAAGVRTVLNPAPAAPLPQGMLALCDYVTPNETEAAALAGMAVASRGDAERAARKLQAMGAGAVIVTLGADGVLFCGAGEVTHVPAVTAGPVVETTGAGDAFNGGFAAALAEGMDPIAAVRFGNAAAGLSVTRPGTAPSMPARAEIEALVKQA